MKVPVFVTSSAAVLAVWLGVTFVRDVPEENYPQLGKRSLPISAKVETKTEALISLEEAPAEAALSAK